MSQGHDLRLEGRVVAVAARSRASLQQTNSRAHNPGGRPRRRRRRPRRSVRPEPLFGTPPAPSAQSPAGSPDPGRTLPVSPRSRLQGRRRRPWREHQHRRLGPRADAARDVIELGPTAVVELTGLRTPCVLIDRFRAGLKRHMLSSSETGPAFKSGVLGAVRAGGPVAAGDIARV